MVPAPLSTRFQTFTPLPTIKLGPSGAGSRVGGLVHTLGPCGSLQWPLLWGWESFLQPPQHAWAFSIRGLRLHFPTLEPWVTWSASLPTVLPGLSVRECVTTGCYPLLCLPRSPPLWVQPSESSPLGLSVCECGASGSASGQTACPICPTLRQSRSHQGHTSPLPPPPAVPVSAPPTSLGVCFFFIYLVSDFLAGRFSVSSGCARRCSDLFSTCDYFNTWYPRIQIWSFCFFSWLSLLACFPIWLVKIDCELVYDFNL